MTVCVDRDNATGNQKMYDIRSPFRPTVGQLKDREQYVDLAVAAAFDIV